MRHEIHCVLEDQGYNAGTLLKELWDKQIPLEQIISILGEGYTYNKPYNKPKGSGYD
jgi:hypothetical protein